MTLLVICFAAILGAVMSVFLRRLNTAQQESAPYQLSDPEQPDIAVIHETSPDNPTTKILPEVFSWGRESLAEYFYYAEIDQHALQNDQTGDLTQSQYFAEVTVSFESDAINAEITNLHNYRRNGFRTPRFSLENELGYDTFSTLTPSEIAIPAHTDHYHNLLSISDTDYSLFEINGHSHSVSFTYIKIEASRVISIHLMARERFVSMQWLHQRFQALKETYHELPMQIFTGAPRE